MQLKAISTTFTLLILLCFSFQGIACCDEDSHRLLPIGQWQQQIIFVEFKLFRSCLVEELNPGKGEKNEFWLSGTVDLIGRQGDSISFRLPIDSFMLRECICNMDNYTQKTTFDTFIADYYHKALKMAQHKFNLKTVRAQSIDFNTTKDVHIQQNKRSLLLAYKDLFSIQLKRKNILSAFPTELSEIRNYSTPNFKIIILRLSSNKSLESFKKHQKKDFRKHRIPYWKETTTAHGTSKEYIKIIPR